jgi:excisionase family DNA binding protein
MNSEGPVTITVRRAGELSGLGNTKIWELIKTGELQTVRIGRRRLVLFKSLVALLWPAALPGPSHW